MLRQWTLGALAAALIGAGSCQFPSYDLRDAVRAQAGAPDPGPSAGHSGSTGSSGGADQGGASFEAGQGGIGGQPAELQAGSGGEPGKGEVLFFDDFENGSAAWTPLPASDWSLVGDAGNTLYRQGVIGDDTRLALAGATTWTDVAVQVRVRIVEFGGTETADLAAVCVRYQDIDNYYYVALRSDGRLAIKSRVDGSDNTLGSSVNPMLVAGAWYTVKLEAIDNVINAYVDDVFWNTVVVQPDNALPSGAIALSTSKTSADFDDVTVTSIP